MKKTTFYTLLCTTIILPGTLLAAQQQEQPGTPLPVKTAKLKHQEVDKKVLGTPQLKEQARQQYASVLLSPDTKSDYEARELAKLRKERDEKKLKEHEEVDTQLIQETLKLALEEEQTKRANEKLEQEALILKSREEAAQNEALEKKVEQLTASVESLNTRISSKTESQKLSREQIEALSLELKTKTEELASAQKELRERKAKELILAEQVITEREGKKRLEGELKARAEKKIVVNAGGGDQGGAGQGQGGGGGAVVVNDGAQGLPQNIAQPNINAGAEVKEKKAMKKANFGAQNDGQKDGKL